MPFFRRIQRATQTAAPLVLFFAILTTASCNQAANSSLPPANNSVARIVSSFPKKGLDAAQSKLIVQAIDLAIEQNQSASAPWTIEHISLDGGSGESGDWTKEQEQANATLAANDSSVVAYIGPYTSGATGKSLPITNRAGLLQLGPTATWPGLTLSGWEPGEPGVYYPTGKRTFARMTPPDSRQGTAAANWVRQAGSRSVYILSDGSTYSDGLAADFVSSARMLGLNIAGSSKSTTDPASISLQITKSAADAVFYAPSSVANATRVAKALKGVKLSSGVFSGDVALSDQFLESAGDAALNWHVVFNGITAPPASPAWERFSKTFQEKYGRPPAQYAANAYDLASMLISAIQQGGGRDRAKIVEMIMKRQDYTGVTGPILFGRGSEGDISSRNMSGYVVSGGRFLFDRFLSDTLR